MSGGKGPACALGFVTHTSGLRRTHQTCRAAPRRACSRWSTAPARFGARPVQSQPFHSPAPAALLGCGRGRGNKGETSGQQTGVLPISCVACERDCARRVALHHHAWSFVSLPLNVISPPNLSPGLPNLQGKSRRRVFRGQNVLGRGRHGHGGRDRPCRRPANARPVVVLLQPVGRLRL